MNVKAVILDCDGVLLDSFREGLRRIRTLAALHDIPFDREIRQKLRTLWGMPGIQLLANGFGITETLAERIYTDWEKMDLHNPVPFIPGSRETLFWLRKNDIRRCLLTSRRRDNITTILDATDYLREFDLVATREDAYFPKPHRRAFDHVLVPLKEKFGISKRDCIFIGDTPADLLGGRNARIKTLITQTGPYLLEHSRTLRMSLELILPSIDDLPDWIEKHHDDTLTFYK